MIKKRISPWIGLLALCCAGTVLAADATAPEAGNLLKRKSVEETITARLEQARQGVKITSVRPSIIAGLYQAQVAGGPMLYVTAEGDKFIAGDLFTVEPTGFAKWEDPALITERKKLLAGVDPKSSIIFKPKGKTKAVVYVFTDVDCGYCRRLNNQVNAYTEEGKSKPGYSDLGIEIRYLAYPRAGIPSASADKLVTAWCSKDKQLALTKLKQDVEIPAVTCDNPVANEFALGTKLGVNGTPAIWMPSGELKPGYLPPEELAKELGIL